MKTYLLCAALFLAASASGESLDETIHIKTLKDLPALKARLDRDLPDDAAGAVAEALGHIWHGLSTDLEPKLSPADFDQAWLACIDGSTPRKLILFGFLSEARRRSAIHHVTKERAESDESDEKMRKTHEDYNRFFWNGSTQAVIWFSKQVDQTAEPTTPTDGGSP